MIISLLISQLLYMNIFIVWNLNKSKNKNTKNKDRESADLISEKML